MMMVSLTFSMNFQNLKSVPWGAIISLIAVHGLTRKQLENAGF